MSPSFSRLSVSGGLIPTLYKRSAPTVVGGPCPGIKIVSSV